MNLRRFPLRAYPYLIRFGLRRLARRNRPPPPDQLTAADLDFFFGGTDSVEAWLGSPPFRLPAPAPPDPVALIAECNSILAHRFDLLGSGPTDLGPIIPWRRDIKTGHEWPRDHISKLRLVTTEGDVKVPWELSRFHHGVTLALGYALTADPRYPREWVSQFDSWRADNPPEHGPNWGNAMEASIRAVNWIAAFAIFAGATQGGAIHVRAIHESPLLKSLIQHGRFIRSHVEDYWPPNNHLLADLCGLIWLGLFLRPPGKSALHARPESLRWLALGLRGLERQLREQTLPDGANYEASTSYHRFVTEMVSTTVAVCDLNGVPVSPFIRDTVAKMQTVLAALRKPDGSLPLFGDEDGGRWLPFELDADKRRLTQIEESISVHQRSSVSQFPLAGWYIILSDADTLAIRAGGNGQAGWGGHAHNDALSFEYIVGARTFLVDPGAYVYTVDPAARDLFRSTGYHNTVRVDGQEISRIPPGELFRLENDVRCRDVACNVSTWEGEHTGYLRRLGVTHRRQFIRQPGGWLIRDTLTGPGGHTLEWFFHFAPGCPVQTDGARLWTAFADGPNIQIVSTQHASRFTLQEGWVSPAYGRRESATISTSTLRMTLPVEVEFIITVL